MEAKFEINENFHAFLSEKGVHLTITKKSGDIEEILLTFHGWTVLHNQLASVKEYITFGNAKIQEWKNKKSLEALDPLLCESIKIDEKNALFLSMYQHQNGPKKGEWAVFASLRPYFVREAEIYPNKKPAIYLNLHDIDKLLSFNGKFYILLKKEKESHNHKAKETCEICSFVENGIIVYHHLDLDTEKDKVLQEMQLCLNDFDHLNHPGSCVIVLKRTKKMPENAVPPKKRKRVDTNPATGSPIPPPPPPPPTPAPINGKKM